MTNKMLASEVIKRVGGKSNITQAWSCFTRLRFNLSDDAKADLDGLKSLEGVLNAQFQGDQLQVIVGNGATAICEELKSQIGDTNAAVTHEKKEKINPINSLFDTISGIFTPALAAITGAGLIKGILSLLVFLGAVKDGSNEHMVLNMISDATFYFLPFLLAVSAAKKFKTNEYVAASLAGILMYPSFRELITPINDPTVNYINLFGFLKIPAFDYSSSVIPIILSVLLLSIVYRFIDKHMPKMLRMIFTPLLALLIVAPIMLLILAPIGNYVGIYVARALVWLFDVAGPFAGLLLGGLMPFIVMTGMHYALFPVAFESIGSLGYDIILLPMNLVNNLAQCAATFAVAIKTKDKTMRSLSVSSGISAVFGITEPAMYGVTLKLKKPLYAAMIGSGIGGAFFGFFVVKAFAFSIPGITSIPGYINPNDPSNLQNLIYACIGIVLSVVISFVLTMIFPFETGANPKEERVLEKSTLKGGKTKILSPLSGEAIALSSLDDDVFAGGVLGDGAGIIPTDNIVKAPFDGIVSMVSDTKHALGLMSDDGIELLIHIGINTVSLDGKGFEPLVQSGDTITKGQNLLKFDPNVIKENGLSTASAIIVTNTSDFSNVSFEGEKNVTALSNNLINIKS